MANMTDHPVDPRKMVFTDEDVERLKDPMHDSHDCDDCDFIRSKMPSLIARLKAAEELAKDTKSEHMRYVEFVYRDPSKHSKVDCRICLGDDTWRKACGK